MKRQCIIWPPLTVLVSLLALGFLILVAYRGYSVILFAPVAALGAVLLTMPGAVLPAYSALFMDSMATFVKNYFPVFMLGALFGKLIEISGFARAIAAAISRAAGRRHAMLGIVVICALMVYGGVSVFVVAFAVYPFAAELFREADIPKRLIPGDDVARHLHLRDGRAAGQPADPEHHPDDVLRDDDDGGADSGTDRRRCSSSSSACCISTGGGGSAAAAGEGYGTGHLNEPEAPEAHALVSPCAGVSSAGRRRGDEHRLHRADAAVVRRDRDARADAGGDADRDRRLAAGRRVGGRRRRCCSASRRSSLFAWSRVSASFAKASQVAIAGCLLATLNTASEFGFGAVIAALPGFVAIQSAMKAIANPLVNEAITVTTLAGMTGSASGGLSLALAAMAAQFKAAAVAAHIPFEVLHRVAAMACGGMDTLPHNGAIITLLAITGLTHRQSYGDIFAITCIKTTAVFVVIAVYYLTGIV